MFYLQWKRKESDDHTNIFHRYGRCVNGCQWQKVTKYKYNFEGFLLYFSIWSNIVLLLLIHLYTVEPSYYSETL